MSVTKNKRFLMEEVGLRRIKVWIGAALQKGKEFGSGLVYPAQTIGLPKGQL